MNSPLIDRALLASLLGALAGPCLAQYGPYAASPEPYQYPRHQYSPYRYPAYQTYRYPPQQPYRYAQPAYRYPAQPQSNSYAQPQPYRDPQPQAYRYSAPQQSYSYPAQRAYGPPAQEAYQPRSADGYSAPQEPGPYAPQRAYSPPAQAAYQPADGYSAQQRPDSYAPPQAYSPPAQAGYQPPTADYAGQSSDGVLLTPSQDGSKDVTSAAMAPLHDLNLTRQTIPPVLLTALADPYAAPPAYDCATLISQVDELTQALGPDYDNLPPPHTKGVAESGGLGLTLVHGAAASLLPYDGFIKTLSGASKHDNLVLRALAAGGARRAYLKGLGEDRQCAAGGAAPRHGAGPAAAVYDSPWRPKYPIWWDRAG